MRFRQYIHIRKHNVTEEEKTARATAAAATKTIPVQLSIQSSRLF